MNKLLTTAILICLPGAALAEIYSSDSTVWASTLTLLIGDEADWQEGYILDTNANTFRQVRRNGEKVINPKTVEMSCSESNRSRGQGVESILCFDAYQDRIFSINTIISGLPFTYMKRTYGGVPLTFGTCTKV
jgi:hypothetical protein